MRKSTTLLFLLITSFYVFSQGPTANFTANPLVACIGSPITFTSTSVPGNSPIVKWQWDFGDGNSALGPSPTHIYNSANSFIVTLIVTDQNNVADPEVKVAYITINPLPQVAFTTNQNGCVLPVSTAFTNQSVTGANYSYSWDFGNGETSNDQHPAAVNYTSANNYNVALTVTNTQTGCVNTVNQGLVVSDFSADFNLQDSACIGSTVQITDASSVNANGWSWNSGEGQNSALKNPSFTYNTAGIFTVSLTSTDSQTGCSSTKNRNIVIIPLPVPSFTANPSFGCVPFNTTFTNTTVGGSNYTWNFGDGSPLYMGATPVAHTYNSYGYFTVSLTGAGAYGCIGTTTRINYIHTDPPVANFTATPYIGCSPITSHFTNSSYSLDPIVSWLWDFGNGTTSLAQNPPDVVYTAGQYTVSLTIATQSGCIATKTRTNYIQVGEIDFVNFSSTPDTICSKTPVSFSGIAGISIPYSPGELNWYWNFGDGGQSIGQNPTWTFPKDTGNFDVKLTLVFRGCSKSFTKQNAAYIKAPISKYDLPKTLFCNPNSFPVNVQVTDKSKKGKLSDDVKMIWKWGDPLNSTTVLENAELDLTNDGSSSFNFPDYGVYTIEQVVYNYTTGCQDSITNKIVITHTTADFSLSAPAICKNDAATFTSTSTSLFGIDYYNFQLWNGHDTLVNKVSENFNLAGTYPIRLTVIDINGCANSKTIPLVVHELPLAKISPSVDSQCAPIAYTYTNTSIPQGNGFPTFGSFEWTLPDGTKTITNSLAYSPTYNFLTQGTFITTMVATDDLGCVSAPTTAVMHITLPTPLFTMDSVICDLEEFTALNETVAVGVPSYQWTIDNKNTSILKNLVSSFDENNNITATYVSHKITLIATDGTGCTDNLTKTIKVSIPHADLTYIATGTNLNSENKFNCPPVTVSFKDSSASLGTYTTAWDFGGGKNSTLINPSNSYVFAGNYTLNLVITDEFACTDDTTSTSFLTIGGPSTEFSILHDDDYCHNTFIFDTINAKQVSSLTWHFGDETSSSTAPATHNYPLGGTYYITLNIQDDAGCDIPYFDTIQFADQLDAYFVPNTILASVGEVINFDDQSILNVPGISWYWEFGDFDNSSITNSTAASTTFTYNQPYLYPVKLTVRDENGCTDSHEIVIHITGDVEIPNIFTPNNDGKNDLFAFAYDIFKYFDVQIMNRWGNLVYVQKDVKGLKIWDGNTNKGDPCTDGIYYYIIKGELLEGSTFEKTGFLTKI